MNLSDWFWQWGQFLDHDLDLSEPGTANEPFSIPVPEGDPFFDENGKATPMLTRMTGMLEADIRNDTATRQFLARLDELTTTVFTAAFFLGGSSLAAASLAAASLAIASLPSLRKD